MNESRIIIDLSTDEAGVPVSHPRGFTIAELRRLYPDGIAEWNRGVPEWMDARFCRPDGSPLELRDLPDETVIRLNTSVLRGLTLLQPWASCIAYLDKRLENRPWPPPPYVVGTRIAIHAGQRFDVAAYRNGAESSGLIQILALAGVDPDPDRMPRGVVLATAVVDSVVRDAGQTLDGELYWFRGPLAWRLTDVRVCHYPVPCRGLQKLWFVPPVVELALQAQGAIDPPVWKGESCISA